MAHFWMGEVMLNLPKAAVLTAAVVLALAGCDFTDGGGSSLSSGSSGSDDTELSKSYDDCDDGVGDDAIDTDVFEVGDGGHTLLVDGAMTANIADLACILGGLGTSQAVVAEIDSTTSMMGRQEADSGDYHYAWSYHPDNGIDMIVTDGDS